jgi:DNA gyrase inhibitor GyrI
LAQSLKNGIINGGPVAIGKFEGTLEEFEEFKQEIYKRKSGQKDKTETSYIQ